ncbi:unnamed protein product [Kuraishia capsulata CBS 1993]|uniref:UV radiation resistance-associated gene protein n=1 Tax=Kuraishia capsulata CBS 1993 TaxID=1382522 RepID=W6MPJ1_9ASCO|nr:uncharacterized protein KUCA_T00004230001 [Kuraishia capsulata CBS 1993]CDK28248.1 unnamed protein product [Kuraishia capsulata CBS 1993]
MYKSAPASPTNSVSTGGIPSRLGGTGYKSNEGGHPFRLDSERMVIRHLKGISVNGIRLDMPKTPKPRRGVPRSLLLSQKTTKSSTDLAQLRAQHLQEPPFVPSGLNLPRRHPKETIFGLNDAAQKQYRLQEINGKCLVDTFVSLHDISSDEPFYITEVVKDTAFADFEDFDLTGLKVAQRGALTIMVWCREHGSAVWTLLMRTFLRLTFLEYVGESHEAVLAKTDRMRNTIVLRLGDGYYLVPESASRIAEADLTSLKILRRKLSHSQQPTCSFDQILKLNSVQMSVVDTLSVKQRVAAEVNQKLEEQTNYESQIADLRRQSQGYNLAISQAKLALESLQKSLSVTRSLIRKKAELIHQSPAERVNHAKVAVCREEFGEVSNALEDVKERISVERARIASEIAEVFPMESSERGYEFAIFGLKLPSSPSRSLSRSQETETAAVLGFVCQVIYMLSAYLRCPLRYPVEPFGSHSYIMDPISIISGSRMFPLWVQEKTLYRFEYGLMLVCKDIEQLMESVGLRTAEPRNILGNLKMLLLCVSSRPDSDVDVSALENANLYKSRLDHIKRHLNQRSLSVRR